MIIAAIVAMDKNGAIGQGNKMPWYLPNDLKYFKNTTTDSVIIMGRKTFESIGRKLPNRINIILSREKENGEKGDEEGVFYFNDFNKALNFSKSYGKNIFITGGGEIYKKYISQCNYLYVTHINLEIDKADAYFPKEYLEKCKTITRQKGKIDRDNKYEHEFVVYKKV